MTTMMILSKLKKRSRSIDIMFICVNRMIKTKKQQQQQQQQQKRIFCSTTPLPPTTTTTIIIKNSNHQILITS
ncbi:hypothetical protein DERF_006749 [Dermatophagoides farinae]|uniref:Uncharacterized protein n=1 Tax=Dermatophagoides farinae TaxID=6954 RepID=A0A922L2X6_DERFA|nr:hypothetical protein DERF_006749 [Dermatophagoides farinae]